MIDISKHLTTSQAKHVHQALSWF